eukprot:Awhi_evm1s5564
MRAIFHAFDTKSDSFLKQQSKTDLKRTLDYAKPLLVFLVLFLIPQIPAIMAMAGVDTIGRYIYNLPSYMLTS